MYVLRFFRALIIVLLVGLLFACGGGGGSSSGDSANTDQNNSPSSNNDSNNNSNNLVQTSAEDQALFIARSSSSSDVMNIGGQSITLESGAGYIYRFLPDVPALERFDSTYDATNNYSCEGAGAQKPYTSGQLLFNIEVCPNYGSFGSSGYSTVDIEQVNTGSGELIGSRCDVVLAGTSQVSIEVAYLGGFLYYADSNGNLKRNSLGCNGAATTILTAGDSNNNGTFYAIDGSLVSVRNERSTNDRILVRVHDADSGVITSTPLTISAPSNNDIHYSFHEGDDALYWTVYNWRNYDFSIYRYELGGTVENLLTPSLTDARTGSMIDASGGKVLVAYEYVGSRNDSGYATSWETVTQIYDVATDSWSTLNLDARVKYDRLQYLVY